MTCPGDRTGEKKAGGMKMQVTAVGMIVFVVVLSSGGCAAPSGPQSQASTRAETPEPLQAPEREPQEVRERIPPPQIDRTASPSPVRTGTSPVELRIESGWSMGRSPRFRDNNSKSPDCFILTSGAPGDCGGSFDQIGTSGIIGIGVGYGLGNGKRVDIGYSRRSGFELLGSDPAGSSFDPAVTTDTIMMSGAFELPVKWGSMRPYVGAGIGVSRNEMGALKWKDGNDSGTLTGGKKTSFAWSLTLGAELDVSENVILEFGYRYMDLGKFEKEAGPDQQPGQFSTFNASGNTGSATGRLRTDELLLNLRIGWFAF